LPKLCLGRGKNILKTAKTEKGGNKTAKIKLEQKGILTHTHTHRG